jgi:hypothetical protein
VEVIGLILLALAFLMCFYALFSFLWRNHRIASHAPANDSFGPICLAGIVVLALFSIFIISLREFILIMHPKGHDMAFFTSSFFGYN